jgi:surface antigen
MKWLSLTSCVLAIALAGCSTSGSGSSMVGAFAQSSEPERPVAAAIVDAMAGGLIGTAAGSSLDQRELTRALEAEYRALEYTPVGQSVDWGTRGGRRYGVVAAGSPYRVGQQNCRQYSHTAVIDGNSTTLRGTACRNEDGSWTPLV